MRGSGRYPVNSMGKNCNVRAVLCARGEHGACEGGSCCH